MTWEHDSHKNRHKPSKSHWYFDGDPTGICSFFFFSSELWVNHVTSCLEPALCCNSLNQMGNLNAWLLGKLDLILCEEPSIPKIVVGMAQQHSKLSTNIDSTYVKRESVCFCYYDISGVILPVNDSERLYFTVKSAYKLLPPLKSYKFSKLV